MEAIGQLTGGIAHDFNNMLTAILLNAEVLATQIQNESLRQLAEAMRLPPSTAPISRRGLAFGRRQTLVPRPTDVNALLGDMAPLMQRTLGERSRSSWRGENLWPATIDRGQLESAGSILRSTPAMPYAGWRPAGHRDRQRRARRGLRRRQSRRAARAVVMVAVGDTGIGIAAKLRDRVFEPFFTTKATGKGTGLGLSMVYGFVKQSEGHARIYSEVGVGTVVRLYLPRSKEVVTAAPSPARRAPFPRSRSTRRFEIVPPPPAHARPGNRGRGRRRRECTAGDRGDRAGLRARFAVH
jgi:signal transduction histidine kinase